MEEVSRILKSVDEINNLISNHTGDQMKLLNKIAEIAMGTFDNCDTCNIFLYNEAEKKLILEAAAGLARKGIKKIAYIQGSGLTWYVYADAQVFRLERASDAKGKYVGSFINLYYRRRDQTGGPFLGVPIIADDKETVYGALTFGTWEPNNFFKVEDEIAARFFASQIAGIISKKTPKVPEVHQYYIEFLEKLKRCNSIKDIYTFAFKFLSEKYITPFHLSIFLYNTEGKLERKYCYPIQQKNIDDLTEIYERGEGLVGKAGGTLYDQGKSKNFQISNLQKIKGSSRSEIRFYQSLAEQYKTNGSDQFTIVLEPLNSTRSVKRTYGIIRLIKFGLPAITMQEKEFLSNISNFITSAIDAINVQKLKETISEAQHLFNESNETEVFNRLSAIFVKNHPAFVACMIHHVDETEHYLQLVGHYGCTIPKALEDIRKGEGLIGHYFRKQKYSFSTEIQAIKDNIPLNEFARTNGLNTLIAAPVKALDKNNNIAVISFFIRYKYNFDGFDFDFVDRISAISANIIHNYREKNETKLLNRISEQLISSEPFDKNLSEIARLMVMHTKFDHSSFFMLKQGQKYIVTGSSAPESIGEIISIPEENDKEIKKKIRKIPFDRIYGCEFLTKHFINFQYIILIPVVSDQKLKGFLSIVKTYPTIKKENLSYTKSAPAEGILFSISDNFLETLRNLITTAYEKDVLTKKLQQKELSELTMELSKHKLNALKAQMDYHFVSNVMSCIQSLIINQEPESLHKADKYIAMLGKLIRKVLRHSSENKIKLTEEIELLKMYVEIMQLRYKDRFSFEVKTDNNISLEEIEIPSMLLQPFIENAIIHGILPDSHIKGKINLSISEDKQKKELELKITDNGLGYDIIKQMNTRTMSSLVRIHEQIKLYKRIFSSEIKISTSLNSPNSHNYKGTKVNITIPL